jgi:hypothetical protein
MGIAGRESKPESSPMSQLSRNARKESEGRVQREWMSVARFYYSGIDLPSLSAIHPRIMR